MHSFSFFSFFLLFGPFLFSQQSTSTEDAFFNQTQEKIQSLKKEDQSMIERDKKMMEANYDPNEGYEKKPSVTKAPYADEQQQLLEGKNL